MAETAKGVLAAVTGKGKAKKAEAEAEKLISEIASKAAAAGSPEMANGAGLQEELL